MVSLQMLQEWLLCGRAGGAGAVGPQGPQGLQGLPGTDGAPGAPGAPERQMAAPRVYTIGYAGRDIDGFLSALLEADLAGVVDVRNSPASRAYGFSRRQLEKHLGHLSLRYIGRPELGVPSSARRDIGSRQKRQTLLKSYEEDLRASRMAAVDEVANAMEAEPLALMCMESAPEDCHRSVLARAIAERTGLPVRHI